MENPSTVSSNEEYEAIRNMIREEVQRLNKLVVVDGIDNNALHFNLRDIHSIQEARASFPHRLIISYYCGSPTAGTSVFVAKATQKNFDTLGIESRFKDEEEEQKV